MYLDVYVFKRTQIKENYYKATNFEKKMGILFLFLFVYLFVRFRFLYVAGTISDDELS